MEREVSMTTEITVTIMSVAALLGIVAFLVLIGKGIQSDASEKMVDINDNVGYDYVVSLAKNGTDNEMPAVTAYNILTKYGDYITWSANLTVDSLEAQNTHACKTARAEGYSDADYLCSGIRNLQIHGSDIADSMKGRVQLELIPVEYKNTDGTKTHNGTYFAIIHPEKSTWKSGVVDSSCEYVGWYDKLMRDNSLDVTWRAENLNGCAP